ncbi:hypothetical protein, partial [Stenotrophomonas sp.]|uniref:hypothetical protein n=1 Tax=Stenotrophomonas sp. TaxID=69392 RepID=UPI0028AFF1C5
MAWIYRSPLLVGADRWSAHLSDIDIQKLDPTPCRPTVGTHLQQQQVLTDRGKLSKAGWVRLRGCERH